MNEVQLCMSEMRTFFASGTTLPIAWRKEQLKNLKAGILSHEPMILEALSLDLGKSDFEGYATELGVIYEQIDYTLKHIDRFSDKKRIRSSLISFPSKAYTVAQPLGVVLIMSPWNYPFHLSIAPLVSAMAAGNCAIVKPSRYSAYTSKVLKTLLAKLFPSNYIATFEGGSEMNQELLSHRFDHIFFTGSPHVGKIVMERASRTLTPVTLELGGKSPVIVDAHCNISLAARRIVWGKCLNAGQTCIAPDYVLVHKSVQKLLIEEMKQAITAMYGSDPLHNEELGHIINDKHFSRLVTLMGQGKLAWGGQLDPKTRKIAPTILVDVPLDSDLMQQEIFGPLLPIISYNTFSEAVAFVAQRPHPLALYLFSENKEHQKIVVSSLLYGGGCINDTVMHLSNPRLPFGGVGESGMGCYHAKNGFDTFSHTKSILQSKTWLEIKLRYAPYRGKLTLLKRLLS